MANEAARRELAEALEPLIGPTNTATLMGSLHPETWDELATKTDLVTLRTELRGEMAGLRGEMAELRGELRGEMAEVRGEMAGLRGEMAEFRGEIGELRGAISSLVPKLAIASLGTSATLFGLVLAGAAVLG